MCNLGSINTAMSLFVLRRKVVVMSREREEMSFQLGVRWDRNIADDPAGDQHLAFAVISILKSRRHVKSVQILRFISLASKHDD